MTDSDSTPDVLGQVTDELLERHRRGERPAPEDYIGRYPELAKEIRELFSALVMMEEVRPGPETAADGSARFRTGDVPFPDLEDFRIVRVIGRGGMGVVYEAEQESLGRRVALKVLPPEALVGHPTHLPRFQSEARAAARLHHTNIVPVFGVGEERGTHYYVMQYIEGRPLDEVLIELRRLRDRGNPLDKATAARALTERYVRSEGLPSSVAVAQSLREGQYESARPLTAAAAIESDAGTQLGIPADLPVRQAPSPAEAVETRPASTSSLLSNPHRPYAKSIAHIGAQVAQALEYAAQQGVLHRDIKPSNLLLDVWGSVWLTDFGLAKASGTPDLTRTGDVVGTLRYLAPERFQGRVDIRSDIYSLGLTLYEALALRPAFDSSEPARLMRQITTTQPPRLDKLNPQLPWDLVTVVHKAMAKDPTDRYQTAGALAEDLGRFLEDRPIAARRLSALEHGWRWCKRNPGMAGLTAALLVLVLLATGGAVWLVQQQAERRAEAARQEKELRKEVGTAVAQAVSFRQQYLFREGHELLEQARQRLEPAGPDDLLQQVDRARHDLDLVVRLDTIRLNRLTSVEADFSNLQADRDYESAFRDAELGTIHDDPERVAARVKDSGVHEALVAALDDWAVSVLEKDRRSWLLDVARRADPDPKGWRDRVRDPVKWADGPAVTELGRVAPVAKEPVSLLVALGQRLQTTGGDAIGFLRRVQREHPDDFWATLTLGNALKYREPGEAIGYYRVALAIRPKAAVGYYELGATLSFQGWLDEAIDYYYKALRVDPRYAQAQTGLRDLLKEQGRLDEAIEYFRQAVRADPSNVWAQIHLGNTLKETGRLDEAGDHYRQAITLAPKNASAQTGLRSILVRQGRAEDVRVAWQKTLAAKPPEHDAWFGYAELCLFLGREDEYRRARRDLLDRFAATTDSFVAERTGRACLLLPASEDDLRKAAALIDRAVVGARSKPDWAYPFFMFAKGLALYRLGRLENAIAIMEGEASRVAGPNPRFVLAMAQYRLGQKDKARKNLAAAMLTFDWTAAQADDPGTWICHVLRRETEAMILPNLPAFLKGNYQPQDNGERLALLGVCQFKGLRRAAVRLYADAFASDPKLAEDLTTEARYRAAGCAALAGCGLGEDCASLNEVERERWRRQAREWLQSDLVAWAKKLAGSLPLQLVGEGTGGEQGVNVPPEHAFAREQLAQRLRSADRALAKQMLNRWRADPNLAGLRDSDALAKLPPEEQEACRKLWAAVEGMLQQLPR
jgi:serine/threonine-protein kinase